MITHKLPLMLKHLTLIIGAILISIVSLAQMGEYRSASNPYYWKNRKPFDGYWQQDVHYSIKVTLYDSLDIVGGKEELVYYNNSPDTLKEVYFHLYQNAFLKGGYLEQLNLANNFHQKFGKYETAGKGTEIESVIVKRIRMGGQSVDEQGQQMAADPLIEKIEIKPQLDFSIMKVVLDEPILPNTSLSFEIKFKTYFDAGGDQRRRMKTFDAYGNKHFDGVHWYPRICVYDRKFGWETDQHLGKEFYGDFGTFDVQLTMPSHYVMDATGVLTNREEVLPADLRAKLDIKNFKDKPLYEKPSVITPHDGTFKTWRFRAINVHDFAWTADPTYRIGEVNLKLPDGNIVQCISLAQEPHASRWQDAAMFAAKVIDVYSRDFGLYAYPKMIVADARDGMEYPMLTLDGGLSPGYYGLFAHEIGHNWFFGMVGNNETYRASLDEGFTQFLTHWAMTRLTKEQPTTSNKGYVAKNYKPLPLMDQNVYNGYFRDAINKSDMPLNTHSDDFNGALHHGGGYSNVYYKTATMLYNLQYVLGDSLFSGAMQHYFNQWKMAHPYFEDFRNSIINYTHVDLNWFFDQWMETTKTIDYAIKGKPQRLADMNEKKSDVYLVKLKRYGSMQMPIDLMAYSKDGKIYTTTISNTYFFKHSNDSVKFRNRWLGWGKLNPTYRAAIYCPGGLKKVSIDTTYRLADVNQLNNSTKFPVKFSFDHHIKNPLTRRHYILKWRPDLWYNSVDGIKAGLHLNGNYFNYKHIFRATVWYNTEVLKDDKYTTHQPINYLFSYQNNIARDFNYHVQSRFLDGLWMHQTGVQKKYGRNTFAAYFKSMHRNEVSDLAYLLYPNSWNAGKFNNTLNLEYTRAYVYKRGAGQIALGMRNTALGSDYNYASIHLTVINDNQFGKLDFRTRVFAQYMTGDDVAPESRLNAAGANSEQLMDNKYLRSLAFVPTGWLGYGANVNHLHYGGGLNVRGYAGYALPNAVGANQVLMYTGMSGASFNGELELDKLVKFAPKYLRDYLHLDVYLFGDAGVLQNKFTAGEYGLTSTQTVTGNLLVSAGTGAILTIKRWGKLDEVKPLSIRFDAPLFLNNTPYVDSVNLKFRWIIGVSRAF
jgi:aminopeptidase N